MLRRPAQGLQWQNNPCLINQCRDPLCIQEKSHNPDKYQNTHPFNGVILLHEY